MRILFVCLLLYIAISFASASNELRNHPRIESLQYMCAKIIANDEALLNQTVEQLPIPMLIKCRDAYGPLTIAVNRGLEKRTRRKREINAFDRGDRCPEQLAFSSDGQLLAALIRDKIEIWNFSSGKRLRTISNGFFGADIKAFAFKPNCSWIIAAGSSDNAIQLWDIDFEELLRKFEGHTRCVNTVVFSSDGRLIGSGSEDGTVRLWDSDSGMCRFIFNHGENSVKSVAFHPGGCMLASVVSSAIYLWSPESGACLATLREQRRPMRKLVSAMFSFDGKRLIVQDGSKTVIEWDLESSINKALFLGDWHGSIFSLYQIKEYKRRLEGCGLDARAHCGKFAGFPYELVFHPDGTSAVFASSGHFCILQLDYQPIAELFAKLYSKDPSMRVLLCDAIRNWQHDDQPLRIAYGDTDREELFQKIIKVIPMLDDERLFDRPGFVARLFGDLNQRLSK